jgi:hypothetical protein
VYAPGLLAITRTRRHNKNCTQQSGERKARQDSENVIHVFCPHPVIHIVSARQSVFVQRGRSMLP